ncbi:hypothetical protein MKW94_015082, partial [Papaver nudicaule]|nr:hypothetical protein [Papaver nudicaule]
MASSPSECNRLCTVCVAVLIFSLSVLPFKLDGLANSSSGEAEPEARKLMILGSRPPQCANLQLQ